MASRLALLILIMLVLGLDRSTFAAVWTGDFIDLKRLQPRIREFCHIVTFPKGWPIKPNDAPYPTIDYRYSDYEFRTEGLLGRWFLVGAFTPEIRYDSTIRYRVNLPDGTAPVVRASESDWTPAAVVPLVRKSVFNYYFGLKMPTEATFNGRRYSKSGDRWLISDDAARLSPDSAWLVLQSATKLKSTLLAKYQVFFDVYDTETGKKVFTLLANYSGIGDDPEGCLAKSAWLTERYFIIPLGKRRERCVICDFAIRRSSQSK